MSSQPESAVPAAVLVPAGTTAGAALHEIGAPNKGAQAIVVVRDPAGGLRDLSWAPDTDTEVQPVAADTEDGRSVIRHSAAHVLAQAVQDHFSDAKLGIGPPVEDGFYYDFDVAEPFTPEDLATLEKSMRKIIKSGQRFSRRVYSSLDEAKAELAGEPYKLELVDDKGAGDDPAVMEVGAGELTAYDNLNPRTGERIWGDLCRGPHVPTTKYIPAFKLTRSSAAYWRGDQDNADLSASTALRGRAPRRWTITSTCWPRRRSATTVDWARSWICSAFPTSSGRACRSFTRRAESSGARWRTTRANSMRRPGTNS